MAAYPGRRASVTGRWPLARRLCALERRHRQDRRPRMVRGGCAHFLAALRRPDGALDLAVSDSVRDACHRYHGCRNLNLLSTSLVVACQGSGDRGCGLRRAVLLAVPQRTLCAALDSLARRCVHRLSGCPDSLPGLVLWFARLRVGVIVGVLRVRGELLLVPSLSLP